MKVGYKMKKMFQRLVLVLSAAVLICCPAVSAAADGQDMGKFVTYGSANTDVFELNEYASNRFEITEYKGSETNLIIRPSFGRTKVESFYDAELHMYRTTGGTMICYDAIADSAFAGSNVTEIVLENIIAPPIKT